MHLVIPLVLGVSVVCLACGLWLAYRDLYRGRPSAPPGPAPPTPSDEDVLIFDRVTAGIAELPRIADPRALQAAEAEVMERVAEQYGMRPEEVETIYRRIWQLRHGIRW